MTEPATAPDTKSFSGNYLVWRKKGQQLRKGVSQGVATAMEARREHPPRFRHPTFESAEKEAQRLAAISPETTFIILQEVARVKMKVVADPAHVVTFTSPDGATATHRTRA